MGSRATHSLALHALRCLRRRLHSLPEGSPLSSPWNCAKGAYLPSPVETGTQGRAQLLQRAFSVNDSELEVSRCEGAEGFVSMKDPISSRHLQRVLSLVRSKGIGTVNGKIWGIQQRIRAEIISGLGDGQGAVSLTDQDFLARYLLWRCNSPVGHSQRITSDNSEVPFEFESLWTSSADVSSVGMNDPYSLMTSQNCVPKSHFFSYPSSDLHQGHTPLEASSVKRKRIKKMNKHKQRKLRRRDRHRN